MNIGDKVGCRTPKTNHFMEDGVIVGIELSHVLVEYTALDNRWGGKEREWVPTGAFNLYNHATVAFVWI